MYDVMTIVQFDEKTRLHQQVISRHIYVATHG